jgi:hypothetical protein
MFGQPLQSPAVAGVLVQGSNGSARDSPSTSISIICARCSPGSSPRGWGSRVAFIIRSRYHCMAARASTLRMCTTGGNTPSVLSLKFIEKVSLALYQGTTLVVP